MAASVEAPVDLGPHLLDRHARLRPAIDADHALVGDHRRTAGREAPVDPAGHHVGLGAEQIDDPRLQLRLVLRGVQRQHRLRREHVRVDRLRLVAGVGGAPERRDVEVVAAAVSQADLVVGQLPEDAEVGVERVEVRDRAELVAHVVGDRGHAEGALHRQSRRADRFDRDDLTRQRRLHVHDAVAVHRPVDQRARERLRDAPPVRDGLRVHVTREDHGRTVTERDVPDGVRPVRQHRLELHALEARLGHHRGQERGQLPFLARGRTGSGRPPGRAAPPGPDRAHRGSGGGSAHRGARVTPLAHRSLPPFRPVRGSRSGRLAPGI